MTIILSISDEINPVHLLSDILLSIEGAHDIKVNLPHLIESEITPAGASTVADLAQKTILLGRTAALFAGDVGTAHEVLGEFFRRTNGGEEFVALGELIRSMGLSAEQRSSVALMTFYCKDNNNITTCGHNIFNTYKVEIGKGQFGQIQTVGSGSDDFVHNYQATRNEGIDVKYELYIDIIHRLLMRTIEPFLGIGETFQSQYGSWFELSVFMGDVFEKLPIALKFWTKKQGEDTYDESGPLLYSNYIKHDLFITTVRYDAIESQCNVIRVKDFLDRGSEIDAWSRQQLCAALDFSPKIFAQVLVDETGSNRTLRVCPYFIYGDPLVSIKRTPKADGTIAAKVTIDEKLKALVNGQKGEAELSIGSPRRR